MWKKSQELQFILFIVETLVTTKNALFENIVQYSLKSYEKLAFEVSTSQFFFSILTLVHSIFFNIAKYWYLTNKKYQY